MSTALPYQENYRLHAGMMAVTVHLAFFALLYFGFRWQAKPPEVFMVEMWDRLPAAEAVPAPRPPVPAASVAQPQPKAAVPEQAAPRPDIALLDKEERKKKQAEEKARAAAAARERQEQERRELEEYVARRVTAEQQRVRGEVERANQVQIERHQDMIRAKIRRNIVMPPDVPPEASAEFRVTLLPGGDVMAVQLIKSSGHAAYDNAAERAIYKAQPLPLPAEAALQQQFRELKLIVRP